MPRVDLIANRIARRRLLPRAALVLLFVADAVASHAGLPAEAEGEGKAKAKAEAKARTASPARVDPDVKDTHQKLDAIYRRLGIKREEARPAREHEGCGCRRKQPEEREPESSPRLPELRTPALPPFLGYLLIGLVIAAMLIPLYLSLRTSYRRGESEPDPVLDDEEPTATAEPLRGPWQVDLEECRRLFAAGRLPEAFAALHRAFLLALAAEHHLTLDARTTNWEYVRRLSSRPELRQTLSAVTVAAEAAVLGQRPPTPKHYRVLEERVIATSREASS